jgi:MYXO-CTERM domain-containing protein
MVPAVRFASGCLAGAVVLAAFAADARPASAFCRTTTTKAPAGWNPAVSGCWTQGTTLAWKTDRVPYGVASQASDKVSLADATRVADLAFAAWNDAECDGKPVGIEAYDDGPTEVPDGADGDALAGWAYCADSNSCNPVAHDVIVFDDVAWPYNDPVNTLALTTVTYGVEDGEIFEAYTEVNSAEHELTTTEPPPAGGTTYDLQAILTHEAGHFLGLAHATATTSIMYAYYQPGAITLTADDLDAICAVYPPTSPKEGCACTTVGAGTSGPAVAAGVSLVALAGLTGLRRKRRRR